jgi:hypothetical protein
VEVDDGASEPMGIHLADGLGRIGGRLHEITATGQQIPETLAAMRLVLDHEDGGVRVRHTLS